MTNQTTYLDYLGQQTQAIAKRALQIKKESQDAVLQSTDAQR